MEFEDQLLQDAQDDARTVEYIRSYLPQDLKEKFSDDELYYFLDVLVDYYATSGILEAEPDADGCVELDIEEIAAHLAKQAKKDKMGEYDAEDLRWIVEGEMDSWEEEDED